MSDANSNSLTSADHLGYLLAHSGSVVLLQASFEQINTFSLRLIPYVHYVPFTYSGVDLISKIQWLVDNDDLALKIVRNAKNFGKSYLRLEDHFCYMATALTEVSKLAEDTDVNEPFNDPMYPLSNTSFHDWINQ